MLLFNAHLSNAAAYPATLTSPAKLKRYFDSLTFKLHTTSVTAVTLAKAM
jgi:hypothetical protein